MTIPTGSQARRELGRCGFPLFLHPRERAESLLSNTAPAYLTLLLVTAVLGYAGHVLESLSDEQLENLDENASTRVIGASLLMLIVLFVCLMLLFVLRCLSVRVRSIVLLVGIVLYLGLGFSPARRRPLLRRIASCSSSCWPASGTSGRADVRLGRAAIGARTRQPRPE